MRELHRFGFLYFKIEPKAKSILGKYTIHSASDDMYARKMYTKPRPGYIVEERKDGESAKKVLNRKDIQDSEARSVKRTPSL